jgi:hypothetical protein
VALNFSFCFSCFALVFGRELKVKVAQQFLTWTIKLMFVVLIFYIQLLKYYITWTTLTQFILFSEMQFFWRTID